MDPHVETRTGGDTRTPQPSEPHLWIGGPLVLHPSKMEGAAHVKSGAPVQIVSRAEGGGVLVAFPPVPFLVKLEPKHYGMLHPPVAPPGRTSAPALTPEGLLTLLQHPQIVPMIQHLVATQPAAAKAAALPLVQPLIAAFAAPEHMALIQAALTSFGLRV